MTQFFAALLIVTCCTATVSVRAECVDDHLQARISDGPSLIKTSAPPQALNAPQLVLPQGVVRAGATRRELLPMHADTLATRNAATIMGAAGLPATLAPRTAAHSAEATDVPRSREHVLLLVGLALMVGIALRRNGSGRP